MSRRPAVPEPFEVLVRCLRAEPPQDKVKALRALRRVDWDAVVAEARRQVVAPLTYHRLAELADEGGVPSRAIDALGQEYRANAWRNLRLYAALAPVLRLLESAGVDVIVLKGTHLAHAVYGNVALRVVGDVDILVHEQDVARAEALVLANGFTADEKNATVFAQSDRHFAYHSDKMHLEVHWALSYPQWPYRLDLDGIWGRSGDLGAGMPARAMAPEDAVLHNCFHAACHHLFDYSGLRALCDVVATCERYGEHLDWDAVVQGSQAAGIRNATFLTFTLAVDLLGADVPGEVLRALDPGDLHPQLMIQARARLQANSGQGHHADPMQDTDVSGHFGRIGAASGAAARARATIEALFPEAGEMERMYGPRAATPLRYPLYLARLGRLALTRGRTILGILGGDEEARGWASRQSRRVQRAEFVDWLATG